MVIGDNKKAIIWSGIDKVAGYVVHFGIQIILARLLLPDDYTVVAMLAIFFSISQAFIDSGFATTLIQRKKCTETDYSSVFYFNIFISLIMYGILYISAPFIEDFYNFKNLAIVTRIYSIALIINAIGSINRVILTKELKFKKIAVVSLSSSIFSAIPAIIMAYNGFGYWALVFQNIISSAISVILFFHFSKWHPTLLFSLNSLRSLAPFGLRILVVYIFHAVYNNIYSLLIGKRYVAQDLGYYDRGKTLAGTAPIGFSDFFSRALYPIQSKQQDNLSFLEVSYNKSFAISTIVIVPICVFLCVFSDQSVYTLFGEQWLKCSPILSILSIGYIFYPLQAINMSMLKVGGRADYLLYSEILKKIFGLTIVFIAINYSLNTVIWGWTLCAIIDFIISIIFFLKLYHFKIKMAVTVFFKQLILSFSLAICIYNLIMLFSENVYITFFCGGLMYLIIYGAISYLINPLFLRRNT